MIVDIDEETIKNSPLTSSDKKWLSRYLREHSRSDFPSNYSQELIKRLIKKDKKIDELISNQYLHSVNISEINEGSVYFVEPNDISCDLEVLNQFLKKLNELTNNKDIIWIPKVPIFTFTIRGDKNDT